MIPTFDVVIVGAGHAGANAAVGLRANGHTGSIALLSNEPELPYERPPLSKDYLSGTKPFERMLLRPESFWHERSIEILRSQQISTIDVEARQVHTAAGCIVGYGTLIWAAGGRPRELSCSGAMLRGIHTVRTRAHVDKLSGELSSARSVVILGGGFIGLEVAAVLAKAGTKITLVEALPRVLARVCGEPVSHFYEAEHRAHGVTLCTSVSADCIEGTQHVTAVRLSNGELIPADVVVVGIGIVPNIEPLVAAGALASNGVHVDEVCRTSLPHIYAIGDCAAQINPFAAGSRVRLESVQNANEQALTVAKVLCNQPATPRGVPWFWSDQYDLKLQTVGIASGYDRVVVRGNPTSRSFSVGYLRQGQVIAFDCISMPRDYVQGRKLVAEGTRVDPVRLADPTVALKDLH